jgi:hypothetical protein
MKIIVLFIFCLSLTSLAHALEIHNTTPYVLSYTINGSCPSLEDSEKIQRGALKPGQTIIEDVTFLQTFSITMLINNQIRRFSWQICDWLNLHCDIATKIGIIVEEMDENCGLFVRLLVENASGVKRICPSEIHFI